MALFWDTAVGTEMHKANVVQNFLLLSLELKLILQILISLLS